MHAADVIVGIASVRVLNQLYFLLMVFSKCKLFTLAKTRRTNRLNTSEVSANHAVSH